MKVIQLKHCRVVPTIYGAGVIFTDGTFCDALDYPDDPHYQEISKRCGYNTTLDYCQEHEFAHCFLEEKFHDRPSQVLHAIARTNTHGPGARILSGKEAVYEELSAQTFQRWLRAGERPIVGGINWDQLKAEALALLDGPARLISEPIQT